MNFPLPSVNPTGIQVVILLDLTCQRKNSEKFNWIGIPRSKVGRSPTRSRPRYLKLSMNWTGQLLAGVGCPNTPVPFNATGMLPKSCRAATNTTVTNVSLTPAVIIYQDILLLCCFQIGRKGLL